VFYLGGLREEAEGHPPGQRGWLLFRPNRSLAEMGGTPAAPGVYVGPDGRITTSDPRRVVGVDTSRCDQDRKALAGNRHSAVLDILPGRQPVVNASFYLHRASRPFVVFDSNRAQPAAAGQLDFGPLLRQRHEDAGRRRARHRTPRREDSNDISAGLPRVVSTCRPTTSWYSLDEREADGRYPHGSGAGEAAGIDVARARATRRPIRGRSGESAPPCRAAGIV